jgi:hypothetical protein
MILSDGPLDLKTPISISSIRKKYWVSIVDAMKSNKVNSLYDLINFKLDDKRIVGETNIERLYLFLTDSYSRLKLGKI